MAKNAGQTVAALLAKAPPPPRAQPSPTPTLAPDPTPEDAPKAESGPEATPPAAAATVIATRSPHRRRSPISAEPLTPTEPSAPPTLRLSQSTAEALRTAWLAAKRDRVLLTYQDFAGEIITSGLHGGDCGTVVDDKSASTASSPVPRTLRLSQSTAEALRTAWLAAKRDRVLLTYQDFAGEIITSGLRQVRQSALQQ